MYRKGTRQATIQFTFTPSNGERDVFVAGDFSQWRPLAMKKQKDGRFVRNVAAPPGTYEYKFVVDDRWVADPDHSHWRKTRSDP